MSSLMNTDMHIQPETFPSHGTFKMFLSCVVLLMACELWIQNKTFCTLLARVGLFSLWMLWWEISLEIWRKLIAHSGYFKSLNCENKSKISSQSAVFRIVLMALLGRARRQGYLKHFVYCVCWNWLADVCVFSGKTRFVFWWKYLPELVHSQAFFGQCGFLWCCVNPGNHVKPLPSMLHGEGCSFMWTHVCWDRCERWPRLLLLRSAHSPGFSPAWFSCASSGLLHGWKSSHRHHIYTFSLLSEFSDAEQGMNCHRSFGHILDTCVNWNSWLLPWGIQEFQRALWFLNTEIQVVLLMGHGFQC